MLPFWADLCGCSASGDRESIRGGKYLLDLHIVGRSCLVLVFVAWSTEKIPGFFFTSGVAAVGSVYYAMFH